MSKTNISKEVRERIIKLQEEKELQLKTIRDCQEEARAKIEAADEEIAEAAKRMDIDSYQLAMEIKRSARAAFDMYQTRYDQIKSDEYISEDESDAVIKNLLDYEEQLADNFHKAASEPIKKLKALNDEYKAAVQETENTLNTWTSTIHANYYSETSSRTLPDGTATHRMENPQPVHRMPYVGCYESVLLSEFLKKASEE